MPLSLLAPRSGAWATATPSNPRNTSGVLAEDRGTSRLYRINDNCVTCFPTAADLVMGKPSPVPPGG
jgi:hypothetical protein